MMGKKIRGLNDGVGIAVIVLLVSVLIFLKALDEKLAISFFALFLIGFSLWSLVEMKKEREAAQKQDEESSKKRKEQEGKKRLFLEKYNLLELTEIASDIVLLEEAVEENYYEHPRSTQDEDKWGVYVEEFFLHCRCTADTYKCVELLRAAGIYVRKDDRCIYEKG